MVFIVSDQRIATENFEKGKIYKVVFLDEYIFYGVCLGIGSNFVMLCGNISGYYLFSLTMETASQVESIDLYTPVEPEPPVPPMTNLLQYQTGLPPFSFNTSGTNLWSYYIKGNTVQNGTPTPTNPVDVVGVGELETTGEHSGQYKIPILSNSTTTPVYLGEVQSTRKVKKVVFTGSADETWNRAGSTHGYFTDLPNEARTSGATDIISSHYAPTMSSADGTVRIGNSKREVLIYDNYTSVTDFKTFLQQQYANGTPVTVWYVLANETTGIDNEPLMKIGDYADSLTSEQAGVQIPTIVGNDTISVSTTVQPSEMQIVYKIADR